VSSSDALRAVLARLVDAIIDAESNRGVFSTASAHDVRCPKDRAARPEDWRGEWVCECGREELDAALAAALRALGR